MLLSYKVGIQTAYQLNCQTRRRRDMATFLQSESEDNLFTTSRVFVTVQEM